MVIMIVIAIQSIDLKNYCRLFVEQMAVLSVNNQIKNITCFHVLIKHLISNVTSLSGDLQDLRNHSKSLSSSIENLCKKI